MHLNLFCLQCMAQPAERPGSITVKVPLQESNLYRFECSAGHQCEMLLQQQRFQLLAEVAAQAIVDGYHREAVTSFAGSLERFMEFAVRVIALHHGVSNETMEQAWKPLANRSERQAGASVMATLLLWQEPPARLGDRFETLRNKVVHKGYVPSRDEAVEFGQAVIHLIQPVLTRLHADCLGAVSAVIASNDAAVLEGREDAVTHTHVVWSLFEMHAQPFAGRDLAVELLRRGQDRAPPKTPV